MVMKKKLPESPNDNITYCFEPLRLMKAEEELTRLYGKRYLEYRKQFQLSNALGYEPRFPLYLMLEQTYRCNLRCGSCVHGHPHLRNRYNPGISCMPWSLFERIILEAELYRCPSLAMHVNDEPLLVKDLGKRIAFARKHGFMDILMTTNGLLLSGDRIKEVIEAGVTRILFSLDACTRETYRKVRGGNLDNVLRAIAGVKKYRNKLRTHLPIIRASFVPTALNRHELESFKIRFAGIADYIDIQPLSVFRKANSGLVPSDAQRVTSFRCSQPWSTLVVRGNGDVLPCCSFYGPRIVLGNAFRDSLYNIFNSGSLKQMRSDFKGGRYRHKACSICSKTMYRVVPERQR